MNRAFSEGITCDQTIRCWFPKFHGRNTYYEDREGRNTCSVK